MIVYPTIPAAEAVQNGLRFLDEHYSGWRDRVSTSRLDITSNYDCPLAQASNGGYTEAVFTHTFHPAYSRAAIEWALEYGFCGASHADDDTEGEEDATDDPSWTALQQAWLDALAWATT